MQCCVDLADVLRWVYARYVWPEGAARYQRNPDHIVSFLKSTTSHGIKIPENGIMEAIFSWHKVLFEVSSGKYSHQPFNLYSGGKPMKNNLELYMPCSK